MTNGEPITLFIEYRKDRFADEPTYHKTVIQNCSWSDRRAVNFSKEGASAANELYVRIPTKGATMEADAQGRTWIDESAFFDKSGRLVVNGDEYWTLTEGAIIVRGEYEPDTPPTAKDRVRKWTVQSWADDRYLNNTPRLWHWRVTAK